MKKREVKIVYQPWFADDLLKSLIYSYVYGFGNDGTFVSNQYLSELFCVSQETIKRRMRDLEGEGYIFRNMTHNNRRRYINLSKKRPSINFKPVSKKQIKNVIKKGS